VPFIDVGSGRIPRRPAVGHSAPMSYIVYFRDSEEGLHSLSHRAASESEALDWFTRVGITVVAIIRAEFA
jgi:hypothetical protein